MGEDFLIAKKERFDHQRDQAVEQKFKAENLFSSLPDVRTIVFRCALTSRDHSPEPGDHVVVASLEEGTLQVLYENTVMGKVLQSDGEKLRTLLTQSGVQMLAATVHNVARLTPHFTIAIDTVQQ
jgi:hypothetical protein